MMVGGWSFLLFGVDGRWVGKWWRRLAMGKD